MGSIVQHRALRPGRTSNRLSQAMLSQRNFMQAVVLVAVCALFLPAALPVGLARAQEAGEVSVEEQSVIDTDNDFILLPRLARTFENRPEHDDFFDNLEFAQGKLSLIDQTSKDGSARQLPAAMCYEDKLLPNVFVFGTPKAGTTTLWAYLVSPIAHDSVWSYPKEPKFLGIYREGWTPTKLATEYVTHFPTCDNANNGTYYVLDGTPTYIYRDLAPTQIMQIYGTELSKRLKFIATLRNPADRILSFFNSYGRALGYIPCDANFDEWVVQELDATDLCFRAAGMHRCQPGNLPTAYRRCQRLNQIVQSWHAIQLFNWFNHFSPDQFMFVDFDEVNGDPEETVHKMFDFTGIPFDENTFQPLIANNGSEQEKRCVRQPEMLPSTREAIDDFFLPLNVQLRNIMVRAGHADSVPAFALRAYDLFMSRKKSETQ
eukprot:jgi/Chlat1/825/Chrsp104S01170